MEEKDNKTTQRTTLKVSESKVRLVREKGYNFSELMDIMLSTVLDIEDDDRVQIQRKIDRIDIQTRKLLLEKQVLRRQLKNMKKEKQEKKIF
jgi:hypothetical protein